MITITRRPDYSRSQRYLWEHDRIGRLHAFGGFTHTFLGAWLQSLRVRGWIRFQAWREDTFTTKTWRLP